jgi:threonine dehydrogenase-like Zn-dependent dehydrogenase
MLALRWDGHTLRAEEADPDPRSDEEHALVRVNLAGVCSTDLQILRGYMAYRGVLGHELVGHVLEGPPAWRGKRVTAEINFACGRCPSCARGLGRHCPTRSVMGILGADGCFAERVRVPVANLHEVPDGVSDEAAVFAEPLAAAFEVLEQVHVLPGQRAAVLGDGKLGLLAAQVLRLAGAEVEVVGKHAGKLHLAREALGLRATPVDAFRPAAALDLVVEATGSERGLDLAIQAVRPRGTLVLKSTVAARHALDLAPLVIHEVTVVGSRCGPFAPALAALAAGRVLVAPLVDAVFPLAEGAAAIERAGAPGTLKVLLRP